MIKIEFEDCTPPEKIIYKAFESMFNGQLIDIHRVEAFTYFRMETDVFSYPMFLVFKNDRLHSFGRVDKKGYSIHVIEL